MLRITVLASVLAVLCGCASNPAQAPGSQSDTGPAGGVITAKSGLDGGTASYIIHIVVPPGRNNAQPNFDVRYSSADGNGPMGMGWDFTTPASIYRCPATLAMDGFTSAVRYAKSDRLCLNSDHLVLASGVYGRPGSTYEEEVTDNSHISLVGDPDSPSSYFIVTYQDGNKSYFKASFSAAGRSEPLYWYLSRYVDNEGGTIDYTYDRSVPGEILLSEISYTGLEIDGNETPGTRFVRFTYEARPDVSSIFLAGGEMRQTRRLAGIVVGLDAHNSGVPPQEIRRYSFSYTQSRATGRSLLSGIHECIFGSDGKQQCLPDTRFSWEDEQLAFKAPVAYAIPDHDSNLQVQQLLDATSIMRSPYVATGDFDGDGRRELLYYRPGVGAHLYFINHDGSLRQDVDVSKFFQSPPEVLFHSASLDIDNDGASDLPGNVGGHLAFLSWTGAGMGTPVVTDIPYSEEMALGYISGGRQPDVLQAEPVSAGSSDFGLYLYRNLGSRPGALRFSKRQLVYALKGRDSGRSTLHQNFYLVGDVDGNGLPDVFVMSGGHVDAVILSRQGEDGSLHFDVTTPAALGMIDRPLDGDTYLADINGDGLFDIVYSDGPAGGVRTWHYQLNRGGHFDPPVDTLVKDERSAGAGITSSFVTDIDNDGREELLYPDKLVVPYCLAANQKLANGKTLDHYQCADDEGGMDSGFEDLSIYRFAILKFRETADGRLAPVVIHDSNIIAQANLVGTGDLQGDGLTEVFSPFSSWFGNGGFRDGSGKHSTCPPTYGCGLHVSSNASEGHEDGVDGAADMMIGAVDGLGSKVFWDYYPLSTTKPGFYSVVPVGKAERYIDQDDYYFTSPLYLVGNYGESSGVGDGYQAYSYQYGDERYSNSGRGLRGFRYQIEHDLSAKYRQISIFDQRFPLDGRLLSQWKVKEDVVDDGLKNGVPPADHAYYLADTWDCEAPKGYSVGGLQCIDSGGPVFSYMLKHKTDHDWDSTLKEWTDVDARYDYDLNTNNTHQVVKTVSSHKVDTVEITRRYAPLDPQHWIVATVEEKTVKTSEPVPSAGAAAAASAPQEKAAATVATQGKAAITEASPGKAAPTKTETDEDDTNEYDDRGRLHRTVQRGPDPYVETRVLSYQQDPKADDYGRLVSLVITRAAKEDAQPDYLRNVRFTHDPGGYFVTSTSSVGFDPHTASYDPVTGEVLTETNDGVTETYAYDILGRVISYDRTEKDKDPVDWSAEYGRCTPKLCIADAAYYVTEVIDKKYFLTTFYNKRGKRMNHPEGSFLKDD